VGSVKTEPTDTIPLVDWPRFFEMAELEWNDFEEVAPRQAPRLPAQERWAWEGPYPNQPDKIAHVEGGRINAHAAYFGIYEPHHWLLQDEEDRDDEPLGRVRSILSTSGEVLQAALMLSVLLGTFLIARRNLKLGRGDRRLAYRYGIVMFVMMLIYWLLRAHHQVTFDDELEMATAGLGEALFGGVFMGLAYLAIEPYVRRTWPGMLIGLTRALNGRLRSPLVGRELLIGALSGVFVSLVLQLSYLLPTWFGTPMGRPTSAANSTLIGGIGAFAEFFVADFLVVIVFPLTLLLFLFVCRKKILTIIVWTLFWLVVSATSMLAQSSDPVELSRTLGILIFIGVVSVLMLRVGLLATAVCFFFHERLRDFPITLDTSAWYWTTSAVVLLLLVAIVAYALWIATARPTRLVPSVD
jgi:serine/threonine-protein kinase